MHGWAVVRRWGRPDRREGSRGRPRDRVDERGGTFEMHVKRAVASEMVSETHSKGPELVSSPWDSVLLADGSPDRSVKQRG